jgi:hypothetical protein
MLTDRQRRDVEAMRRQGRAAGVLPDPPERRFDPVGCWPGDRLHELLAARPDLLDEIKRRRGGELTQL